MPKSNTFTLPFGVIITLAGSNPDGRTLLVRRFQCFRDLTKDIQRL
jgi:hypothetical protein